MQTLDDALDGIIESNQLLFTTFYHFCMAIILWWHLPRSGLTRRLRRFRKEKSAQNAASLSVIAVAHSSTKDQGINVFDIPKRCTSRISHIFTRKPYVINGTGRWDGFAQHAHSLAERQSLSPAMTYRADETGAAE